VGALISRIPSTWSDNAADETDGDVVLFDVWDSGRLANNRNDSISESGRA